jgi:diguanylate cyclase
VLLDGFGELQVQALDRIAETSEGQTSPSVSPAMARDDSQLPSGQRLTNAEPLALVEHQGTSQAQQQAEDGHGAEAVVIVDWLAVREVLARLVTQLPVFAPCTEQIAALNERFSHFLDENSLLPILEQFRELFELSLAVMGHEFRSFPDSVEQRLDTLLSTLGQAREQEQAALTCEQGLANSFQASLDVMRDDAESATDLSVLKTSIDEPLNNLVRSMQGINNEGQFASGERDARLLAMTERLQELEDESTRVRTQLETQRQLALTDALTRLANRKAFDERVSEEIAISAQRETPLALAIADIGHFKRVNDTLGHLAGDRALALFARILQSRVRATDFCARHGGEEFVMLFPATSVTLAGQVVEQVREFVKSCEFSYKGEPVPLTASFGVTEFRRDDDVAMMLERAGKAIYEAKSNGRNRLHLAQD